MPIAGKAFYKHSFTQHSRPCPAASAVQGEQSGPPQGLGTLMAGFGK